VDSIAAPGVLILFSLAFPCLFSCTLSNYIWYFSNMCALSSGCLFSLNVNLKIKKAELPKRGQCLILLAIQMPMVYNCCVLIAVSLPGLLWHIECLQIKPSTWLLWGEPFQSLRFLSCWVKPGPFIWQSILPLIYICVICSFSYIGLPSNLIFFACSPNWILIIFVVIFSFV
jgi:hypothetical protein